MSTTTKEEKLSLLESLKAQAAEISAKIKAETDKHLETLHQKLKAAHEQVQSLTAEIQSHTGNPTPAKRGRKPGSQNGTGKPAKVLKKAKSKRGAVGEAILKYLSTKGKEGAHVKDIAAAVGNTPANITAYFYAGAGKKHVKKVAPATFALKK